MLQGHTMASEYLDTMISSCMKEEVLSKIHFPDKDPEEWKIFYEFITPQQIGEAKRNVEINSGNAVALLPWFHEFQMCGYVEVCDECLGRMWRGWKRRGHFNWTLFWDKERDAIKSEAENQTRLEKRKDS